MMKHQTKGTLLAAVLATLVCSCATHGPLGTGTNTYSGDLSGGAQEFIGDRDLAAKFVLVGLKTETREGRRRVQFDLKNTTSADLRIEWAIEWQDESGFRVDTNPHWKPLVVTGQGFESIQATAPTQDACQFQLQLRKQSPIR